MLRFTNHNRVVLYESQLCYALQVHHMIRSYYESQASHALQSYCESRACHIMRFKFSYNSM